MEGNTEYLAKTMLPKEIIEHIKDDVPNPNILLKPNKLSNIIQLLFTYQRKILGYPRELFEKPGFKISYPAYDSKTFKNGVIFLNDAALFSELVEKIGFMNIDINSLVIKDDPPREVDTRRRRKGKEKEADKPLYSLLSNIINLDIFESNTIPGIREQVQSVYEDARNDILAIRQEIDEKMAIKQKLSDELNSIEYLGVEGESDIIEKRITENEQRIAEMKQNIEQIKLQNEQEKQKIETRKSEMSMLCAETERYNSILAIDPEEEKAKIDAATVELEEAKKQTEELSNQLAEYVKYDNEVAEEYEVAYKAQEEMMDLITKIKEVKKADSYNQIIKDLEEEIDNLCDEKTRIEQEKAESDATIEDLTRKHREVLSKIKTKKRDYNRSMSDIAVQFQKLKEDIEDYNKKLYSELDEM